jgi:hypothetical protein
MRIIDQQCKDARGIAPGGVESLRQAVVGVFESLVSALEPFHIFLH